MSAPHYVACLSLEGRRCLVVGAGRVALEKTESLLAAGASVTVVAPEILLPFRDLPLELVQRPFGEEDLDGCWLVVAATSDRAVNEAVHREAERRRVFCNVADVPDLCSFILPALHRRGPIAVAVSTGGASPALAQALRDRFAAQVDERHERLAEELLEMRPWVRERFGTYEERRDFFRARVEEALA
ncbi:MAG TPA: bifunctional precorrin-2 dehydrogenase/sirohydrochlorin ferrochelatase [Gaiellaceae bacterium]|nr:bifunctional precorrin-2 dehydrogenase/sirohydrochlorin ferrochelatase [Gaiellaceae bacterium]